MKRMMKWAVCLMALVTLLSAVPMTASAATTHDLAASAGNVTLLGRAEVTEDGIAVYTTGAGIAFYAEGAGDVTLTLSAARLKQYTMQCFGVFVDGERMDRGMIEGVGTQATGPFVITLAEDLEAGVHRIEVVRETEENYGSCVFESIDFDGTLSPVAASPLLIEFVGDSLTCGYASNTADLDIKPADVEHPLWEVGTQTYAYLAAQTLGADFQSVCASGYGVVTGWNADRVTLPEMYNYTSYYHSDSEWSFARKADIVVINLGSNDNMRMNATGHSKEDVVAGMKAFMQQVREKNPDAKIVWIPGMAADVFKTDLCQVIADLGGEDMGYYYCELTHGSSGGAGHPSLEEHEAAAAQLVAFLEEQGLVSDYESELVTVTKAEEALGSLSEADAAKLQLECEIASAHSERLTGKLTGLYQMLDIDDNTTSADNTFPWWGWLPIGAAVIAAIGAVIVALVYKKK